MPKEELHVFNVITATLSAFMLQAIEVYMTPSCRRLKRIRHFHADAISWALRYGQSISFNSLHAEMVCNYRLLMWKLMLSV